jgi:cobalt/nickel transport system permease protein
VLALAATLVANMIAPSWVTPALIFVASVVLLLRAGVPRGTLLKRLMVPWYFAAVVLLTQVFFLGQTELFRIGPAVARLEGLWRGIDIASKVVGGTAAVLVLSMTTPMTGLLATAAWLRVPPLVVEIAALTYRYLFLLAEEAERIREAQKTRLGHSSWWKSIRSYSTLGGMVMVNSYDRAERVYQSMVMRGYTGSIPVEAGGHGLSPADIRTLALTIAGLVAAMALGWLL